MDDVDITRLLTWARGLALSPGDTKKVALPEDAQNASVDHRADVARTADDRILILLKQRIGYKDNFEGILASDAPLLTAEVATTGGRQYITIPGHGVFEELYIGQRISDTTYRVFFDLH